MDGILIVDKPTGMTSHDVVAAFRRLTGEKRVGHTGTLDPLATGVLVLCFGAATKALPYLPEAYKTYRVEACLGTSTDTQDRTGRVIDEHPDCSVTHEALRLALGSFLGPGTQLPPMYSAVQVGGERLYRLARAGREVERPEREVEITLIRLDWPSAEERPVMAHGDHIGYTVSGSRGLYVRTLCHDLGRKLGCGAHLVELRRLASGPFQLTASAPFDRLTPDAVRNRLIPISEALAHLPAVVLDDLAVERIRHGNAIPAPGTPGAGLARALGTDGGIIAVVERRGDLWQPVRVFHEP